VTTRILAAVALLALATTAVRAQAPTPAQADAIRASCRSDFLKHCSGVPRGGKEAFECLRGNQDKLSPACGTAVSAPR